MMRSLSILLAASGLSACAEEPMPKETDQAIKATTAENTADAVKERKKTIEEAADAAVKLIEAEARQEIEDNTRADDSVENEEATSNSLEK